MLSHFLVYCPRDGSVRASHIACAIAAFPGAVGTLLLRPIAAAILVLLRRVVLHLRLLPSVLLPLLAAFAILLPVVSCARFRRSLLSANAHLLSHRPVVHRLSALDLATHRLHVVRDCVREIGTARGSAATSNRGSPSVPAVLPSTRVEHQTL